MDDKEVLKMLRALKYSDSIIENHLSNMQKREKLNQLKGNKNG